ncbi:MAG: type 1 glutamine amidotransferase [Pseudomonadota bacterium]
MKPLRIFRHIANEGPGYLAEFLERRSVPYQMVCIDQGDAVPERLDDVSGLVFMGGSMSVNDDLPWIAQELALIRRAADVNLPVLGHCLGGQLISKALGGEVTANPVKEIGWHPVQQLDNAAARDWLEGVPRAFEIFHWHGETFSIPRGATPILTSAYCANQGFVHGAMLALQGHVEMTAPMVADWAAYGQHEIAHPSRTVQSAEEMTRDAARKAGALNKIAAALYTRWLHPIFVAAKT